MSSLYANVRANVNATGSDSRVEVNQRALIDKILARYASAGAVYRELLQNSNDAEATTAEILFTTSEAGIVEQVIYRNDGMPFRTQDWSRLKKIAEGNPDVSKVGAFGVGAYTMFSICEEPLVISGSEALAFVWKGDALWTKTANHNGKSTKWTSFVLPSRDPYPLPNLTEFGEFLCASLTFTQCLRYVRVLVNDKERLAIVKTLVQEPRPVSTPKASSWWKTSETVTTTPRGTFFLARTDKSIMESVYRMTAVVDGSSSTLDARYISAVANTKIPADMARRMERVTKKQPPKEVTIQIFLNAQSVEGKPKNGAERITQSFSPRPGAGRIFIGFRTSQTTGLAAHVAAPFVPTVEREAMDLQDPTLRIFNQELLEMSGILMRLTLEDTMYSVIDTEWKRNAPARERLEKELEAQAAEKKRARIPALIAPAETKEEEEEDDDESSSTGFMGFARFMARGVKKKIVSVVSSVEEILDDGTEYLHPIDPVPLSDEEEQAVVLMRSFCPQQSTPDQLVGTCIARGFAACLPTTAPPVLTRSGVVRGDEARIPNHGVETFVRERVVRSVVFKNAEEYHTILTPCCRLSLEDLLHTLLSTTLEEERLVFLIKWWTKVSRVDPRGARSYGLALKEAIRFYPASGSPVAGDAGRTIVPLKDLLFYIEKGSPLMNKKIPLPESVLQPSLQEKIGDSTMSDVSLENWFSSLPIEIWAEFVSHHSCMVDGKATDSRLRLEVLAVLGKDYARRPLSEKATFGGFLASILAANRCIPFDSDVQTDPVAERPSELYLYSAELSAFDGIGSFRKVSAALKDVGVGEDFLLALGVRKSVSIDFLFASLDTLKWSNDPKPLVEYLRSATLSKQDLSKLSRSKYLPAEHDDNGTFAPSELYLPNLELRAFPFVKMLRWPSESEVSERSQNGNFLVRLGMKTMPPLASVLAFVSHEVKEEKVRLTCLDFLADRLGPHGIYHGDYSRMSFGTKKGFRILPCYVLVPLEPELNCSELHSPVTCYSDRNCAVMGFPVIDPKLGDRAKLYGSLFQCAPEPGTNDLLRQLSHLVAKAKKMQNSAKDEDSKELSQRIENTFSLVFKYLSHRSSDFSYASLDTLKREQFIPCNKDGTISWYRADQVFFRGSQGQSDKLTEELFHVCDFSPFLATAGVKQEATTKELFQLMLQSPQQVLDILGSEAKYRALLRRIAADIPFTHVTSKIAETPFLLAYTLKKSGDEGSGSTSTDGATYELSKAADIYIVDNSFFGRMFPVKRAPQESDLEDFYVLLGASYISKSVDRRFEVVGRPSSDTALTKALKQRILERSPLLVSPNVTSRPLVSNASSLFTESKFSILEASNLIAVYSLNGISRRNPTTCFSRRMGGVNTMYVVQDFDWFDVGYAIGDLILKRCVLEDAFFISSLLEAPVEQLRNRGFPVDRILKPEPPPPPPPPVAPAPVAPPPQPTIAPAAPRPHPASETKQNIQGAASTGAEVIPSQPSGLAGVETGAVKSPAINNGDSENGLSTEGFRQILKQMYPDANEEYIRSRLGSSPTLESVRALAEEMASGGYPGSESASDSATVASSTAESDHQDADILKKSKKGLRKKLGRALQGWRPSGTSPPLGNANQQQGVMTGASSGGSIAAPAVGGPTTREENARPVPAVSDANSHDRLEQMLEQSVNNTAAVNAQGVHSQDSHLTSIPEGLDRGETCEMVPGHSLKPFSGPRGNGKTHNGIRVFSSRNSPESEDFLKQNQNVVDSFALVLEHLCSVYRLKTSTMAIFHDPTGGTIAFNSNRSLHFNLRFFYALHYSLNKHLSRECYCYWFVTIAHELAHHLVSAHNKEHGFYTESYVTLYLPKLLEHLSNLE